MGMFWEGHHAIDAWWPMGIVAIIWVAVIGLLVWLVIRALGHRPESSESAEELLRRRFAAGEIDEEEFNKRSAVLRRK